MSLKDIRTFERKSFSKFENYPSMSINVYTFDTSGTILPMQISDIYDAYLKVNLLYYKNGDNSHYIYITDISKLVGSLLSKHVHNICLCRRCLTHFYKNKDLERHLEICKSHESVKPIMPKIGDTAYFKNYHKKIEHPYAVSYTHLDVYKRQMSYTSILYLASTLF